MRFTEQNVHCYAECFEIIVGTLKQNRQPQHVEWFRERIREDREIEPGYPIGDIMVDLVEDATRLYEILLDTNERPYSEMSVDKLGQLACNLSIHIAAFNDLSDTELDDVLRDRNTENLYEDCRPFVEDLKRSKNSMRRDALNEMIDFLEEATSRGRSGGSRRTGSRAAAPRNGRNQPARQTLGGLGGVKQSSTAPPSRRGPRLAARDEPKPEPEVKPDPQEPYAIKFNWAECNYYGWNGFNGLPLQRPLVPRELIEVIVDPKTNTLSVKVNEMNRNHHQTNADRRASQDMDFDIDITISTGEHGEGEEARVEVQDNSEIREREEREADTLEDVIYEEDVPASSVTPYKLPPINRKFKRTADVKKLSDMIKSTNRASAKEIQQYIEDHSHAGVFRYYRDSIRKQLMTALLSKGIRLSFQTVNELFGLLPEDKTEGSPTDIARKVYQGNIATICQRVIEGTETIDARREVRAVRVGLAAEELYLDPKEATYLTVSQSSDSWLTAPDGLAEHVSEYGDNYLVLNDASYLVYLLPDDSVALVPHGMVEALMMGGTSRYDAEEPVATRTIEEVKTAEAKGEEVVSKPQRRRPNKGKGSLQEFLDS